MLIVCPNFLLITCETFFFLVRNECLPLSPFIIIYIGVFTRLCGARSDMRTFVLCMWGSLELILVKHNIWNLLASFVAPPTALWTDILSVESG